MTTLVEKGGNPFYAISCLFKGLQLLSHKELRKFLWIPLLINIVLYSTVLTLGYFYMSTLIDYFIPDWLSWLEWVLWPLFFISFLIIGFFTFTMLANLIAAPFYSRLSAKTVELLSGQTSEIAEQPMMTVFLAELKRIGYLLTRMLPLLLLFVIPVVNVIAPIVWALFGAWSMALEFMAYPLENRGLLFKEQKQLLKEVRFASLSFGGVTAMGISLPLINLLVSPAAVIGATVYVYESLKPEK